MSDKFYLIPQPGLVVRDPDTAQPLPAEGAEKPKTGYWLRRLMDQDVTEATAPEPPAADEAPVRVATKNKPTKE